MSEILEKVVKISKIVDCEKSPLTYGTHSDKIYT